MFYLPKNTYLGNLELNEIFEFYDIPRLFTCKNKTGQYYLVLSIDEDEEQLIWLYLGISVDRLNLLINKKMDLYSAFKTPENDFLYRVTTNYSSEATNLEYIFSEQLTGDELPYESTYLTEKAVEHHYGLGEVNAKESALSSKREVCNLHFYPSNGWGTELSCKDTGKSLICFQEVIDAIGQNCSGNPTIKGVIPTDILQKTALNICQIFEGSFGIQLKSNYIDNLLEDNISDYSLVSDSLTELLNLFMIKDNEEELKNKLHELKGRAASKYQLLLKELLSIQSDLKIEWGSPKINRGGEFFLEKKVIKSTFDIINKLELSEKETINIKGKLICFHSRTKFYEIRTLDGEKFSGKAADNSGIQSVTINDIYHAEIEKTITTQLSSGEEKKPKYELIKLTPINTDSR
jgi:hypothetical protein